MFKVAIKNAVNFLRPIITARLFYNSDHLNNYISTMIVLNEDGDILTTTSNADLILLSEEIGEVYNPILKELKEKSPRQIKKIEKKYGITNDTVVAMHNIIVDTANIEGKIDIIKHPELDLAIIKSEKVNKVHVKNFPVFSKEIPQIGTSICNIGFAFPEYDAFSYDENECVIKTTNKIMNFPIFPTEGIITRNIASDNEVISMFETSNPALPGQSGGIVADKNGYILGMLVGSKTLNASKDLKLTLGYAINSQTIMEFLETNSIKFNIK